MAGRIRIVEYDVVVTEDDFRKALEILEDCDDIIKCIDHVENALHIPFPVLSDPRWLAEAKAGAKHRVFYGNASIDVVVEEEFTKKFSSIAARIHETLTKKHLVHVEHGKPRQQRQTQQPTKTQTNTKTTKTKRKTSKKKKRSTSKKRRR